MTNLASLRDQAVPANRSYKFVVPKSPPAAAFPIAAAGIETAAQYCSTTRPRTRQPMIEPKVRGMDLLREVFVRRLVDHQIATGLQHAPHLSYVCIPRLGDMLNHPISEDE